jgi:protein kinase
MNKYQIIKIIGDGTYGQVYEGINKETNKKVAIKKLKNKMSSWEDCILQNEVRFLRKLNHENVVKLLEVIREQNSDVSYIFEYCDCNLFQFIENHRKQKMFISEMKIRNIIYQIVCGVKYLHSCNIMHRDLKPENILMIINNNLIKIADFGTAKEIPEYKNNSLTDYVCTRWYRAPECTLKSTNYNEKIDVWAIGCIMAELYTLKPLFPGIDEFDQLNKILKIVGTPEYNEWPEGYALVQKLNIRLPNYNKSNLKQYVFNANDDAIDFLEFIFQLNPDKRPSCSELLKHPYFTEVQRPGSYSYQGRTFKNIKNKNYNDMYFNNNNGNNFYATSNINNEIESPSNERMGNNRGMFNVADSIINGIGNNGYNRDKEENFFKIAFDRGERRRDNNNNFTSFRNSYQNSNQNESQNEISKNNYNYYKNFNYSNYINNNGALPDIDNVFRKNIMNIQNNSAYSKYNNDKDNENILLNSFNQHNSKFSSFAKNEIMQNIKRDKYFSVNKNKRTLDDMNPSVNDQMYNNISPYSRERRKNENRFDSGSKVFFPSIYNYGQLY